MSVSAPSPLVPPPPPVLHGPGRRFHASLRLFLLPLTWLAPFAGAVAGAILLALVSVVIHDPAPLDVILGAALVIFALSAIWTLFVLLIYIAACPTFVSVDGLKGVTFWGWPIQLRWDEISSAEYKSFLGCPFLTVPSNRRRQKLWMAFPLANLDGFRATVREYGGGDDSPIVDALRLV